MLQEPSLAGVGQELCVQAKAARPFSGCPSEPQPFQLQSQHSVEWRAPRGSPRPASESPCPLCHLPEGALSA